MIKTLVAAERCEKTKFTVPRSVQQSIPIQRIYADGIFHVGSKHSKTWRFADVNYIAASEDVKKSIFKSYSSVLNSLPTDAAVKITIINRKLNPVAFEHSILMKECGDSLDKYRLEANHIMKSKTSESNDLVQEKYITLSIPTRKIEGTRDYFRRVEGNLSKTFGRLDSGARPISCHDRLRIFHDFFRPGEERHFTFDPSTASKQGVDFKDYICPDSITFKADHFEMGNKFGRVLFLKTYPSYVDDEMISALSGFSRSLMISIDMIPIPTDEAVKDIQSQILGVEADISRWQQRQNNKNNFSATIPYDLEQTRLETKEFLDDLTTRDQRMFFIVVTLVHTADTLTELDADTESLIAIGMENLCAFSVLRFHRRMG